MIKLKSISIAPLIICFFVALLAYAKHTEDQTLLKLPVDAFASLPDTYSLKLSPNGQHIAGLARLEGKQKGTAVILYNTEQWTVDHLVYTDNKKFKIAWINWANDDYLFLSAIFPATRYGTPTTETRLLKIDIKTGKHSNIFPISIYKRMKNIPQFGDDVIDLLPKDKDHFLLSLDDQFMTEPSVYKVNINNGKRKKIQSAKDHIISWKTDRQHRVRINTYFKDTTYKINTRDVGSKKWRKLWEFEALSDHQVWPLGFANDPNILFVQAYHNDKLAIFTVNLSDPELKKNLYFYDEGEDVEGSLIYSRKTQQVIGIHHGHGDGYTFLEPGYQALQRGINKALNKTNNLIFNFSSDENKYLIVGTSDINPGTYYFGDRISKRLEPLAHRYQKLKPENMAEKQYVSYTARDGQEIYGYLTLPKSGDKHLPTIIFPHGGPISATGGNFDYWTQFFANRGYAVLQMNFRGSSGYGYKFMAAGLKNWGLAMQGDVEDGTRWLIEKGIANPKKICIVGGSYGGYAALMGAATSSLYRCAISFAGVTDLNLLLRHSKSYINNKIAEEMIGTNRNQLKQTSPLRLAHNIEVPILLIHGTKDRRVRVDHSRKMNSALKKKSKDVSYVELKDGDHFLSNNDHRLIAFTKMQSFLEKHLD